MACRLLELPLELLAVVPVKLSARSLTRLACACHQLRAVCLAEAERAVQDILAAGERDDPLPHSLAHLETVFHRLARLCGVRFAPASFINTLAAVGKDYQVDLHWDLAAVEKLHAVLSRCRTRRVQGSIYTGRRHLMDVDLPVDEDKTIYELVVGSAITFLQHARLRIVRREHVDQAVNLLWSARGPRSMKRTRALLEQHDAVDAEDPNYEPTREEEDDDGDVDLEELVDGGADAVGVLVDDAWYPSLSCALHPVDNSFDLDYIYDMHHTEEREDGVSVCDMEPVDQHASMGCTNPLCCHTRLDCRLVYGEMQPESWPGTAEAADAPATRWHAPNAMLGINAHQYMAYGPGHIDRLARLPNTGRLQPLACPRAKRQREEFADYRKWAKGLDAAALKELGISVVEGMRLGDALDLRHIGEWYA